MLIAAISIIFSVVLWSIKSLATGTESPYRSVNDPLPHYRE